MENYTEETIEQSALAETIPDKLPQDYSPNNPPWNSLQAILLLVTNLILIMGLPPVLLTLYFIATGKNFENSENFVDSLLSDTTAVGIALGATFLSHILIMILAWIIVTNNRKLSFKAMLGWEWGGFKWWHGLLIIVGIFILAGVLSNYLGNPENEMMKLLNSSQTAVILVAIIATFSAPIVEEVVFRGVLYSAFQRTVGVAGSVVAVTLIFAVVHVSQYYPNYAVIISILALSLALTLVRVKTNNLLPCIILHFVFNGIQSLLLILQPYLPEALDPTSVDPTAVESLFLLFK